VCGTPTRTTPWLFACFLSEEQLSYHDNNVSSADDTTHTLTADQISKAIQNSNHNKTFHSYSIKILKRAYMKLVTKE